MTASLVQGLALGRTLEEATIIRNTIQDVRGLLARIR